MAQSSASFHEPIEKLTPATLEHHRALVSVMEELEAIDWYQQRIDASEDEELRSILAHNREEEKEHAAMALEWLRRRDPGLDAQLRLYLFTEGPIAEIEAESEANSQESRPGDGSLGIGSLR